jgi:hypothetical protein
LRCSSRQAIDRTRTALRLMLKLDGDRAQKFAANFRRQRPGSVGDRA